MTSGYIASFARAAAKGDNESARESAPGQTKKADRNKVDPGTTASTGKMSFGNVISSVRSGNDKLDGLASNADVTVVDVDTLIRGNNRPALENALSGNETGMQELRPDLQDLNLQGLDDAKAIKAIAAVVQDDGSLTVIVD